MLDLLPVQFIAQNIHFALSLFVSLGCFAAGWLYFDAGDEHHPLVKTSKWLGFFILALGFLVAGASGGNLGLVTNISIVLKLLGYSGILISNFLEPIQPRPITTGLQFSKWREPEPPNSAAPPTPPAAAAAGITLPTASLAAITYLLPAISLLVAGLYWRRATIGLERHIRGVAVAFTILGLSHVFALGRFWETSDNPLLQELAKPFSLLWFAEHITLLLAGLLLLRWVWRYLTKRPQTQLFLFATSLGAAIVLVTTLTITGLLLYNLQKDSLANLETSAKVLSYALDSKTADTRADAGIVANTPAILAAIGTTSHAALAGLVSSLATDRHLTDLVLTDTFGQVLTRLSDPDRYGDSLSSDTFVKRALSGEAVSAVVSQPGAVTPTLVVTSATPLKQSDQIVGAVLASQPLDTSFVDNLKATTGLDSTIYAGAIRTATTLTGPSGTDRQIGARETHSAITSTVLKQGQIWHGAITISNQPYLAIYLPIKDADNTVVGMLAVGQPQSDILDTSNQAIKITFLTAVLWLVLSIVPIYLVCRQIARQLH